MSDDDAIRKQAKYIVDKSPELKRAKDITDGGTGRMYNSSPGGYSQEYKDNWEKIFGNKFKSKSKEAKRGYKLRINGVVVDDEVLHEDCGTPECCNECEPDPGTDPFDIDDFDLSSK